MGVFVYAGSKKKVSRVEIFLPLDLEKLKTLGGIIHTFVRYFTSAVLFFNEALRIPCDVSDQKIH